MSRGIKLQVQKSKYVYGTTAGIRVRITATDAVDMPAKIFAYDLAPAAGNMHPEYSHVCSPVDLEEIAEDSPSPGASPAWFRLDHVDVLLASPTTAEEFVELIHADVAMLVNTLNVMDTLTATDEIVIGDVPVSSSSSGSIGYGSVQSITRSGTGMLQDESGVTWIQIGSGAGSPIGSSDSNSANIATVTLATNEASSLLLVHGFDFTAIPLDAIITGIVATVTLRDTTMENYASLSASSVSGGSPCSRITFAAIQHPELGNGDNWAADDCIGSDAWTTATWGDDTDTGGLNLYGEHVRHANFGFGIVTRSDEDTLRSVTEVDGVSLTVYYREPI